jgi:hypothetical protein
MKKYKVYSKMWFMTLLLAGFIAGCGSGGNSNGGGNADTIAPTVKSTNPDNADTGVPINGKISATFSESMNSSTFATVNFTVSGATGTVEYDETNQTALFTPTSDLETDTTYTGTITIGAMESADKAAAGSNVSISGKEWTFTTGKKRDTTAPTVISTNPADASTGVPINQIITATFSEPMHSSTITAKTFTLKNGATSVLGYVTYNRTSASFKPTIKLNAGTLYTATITTGVEDQAGNKLASNKVWTFTTGATPDTTAPTVISTVPANAATVVAINVKPAAIFSEAMDPATITTAHFALAQGTTAVLGAVTYVGLVATFSPAANLAANTLYIATITTGAKDLAGNTLASNKVWTFTTGAAAVSGRAPVVLGTAGNYVILAKTGISTTGTTAIVGDLGVSPAAASYITGFALTAPPTTFSTSALVSGKVYAADYDPPTPNNLTTAIGDMQIAFTDAAGRTLPDFTELGAGDISGMTLVPGLYKWGTGVLITSAGVTLSGGANDVWIFQIAQDLTVGNGAIVTLSGGAQAKNIFWQVSGQATLGTTTDFKGIILSQTLISLNTGAVMNGRALAQTAVTLDASTVTAPSGMRYPV